MKLTVSERIYSLALLNQFKGALEVLVDIQDDVKNIRMTEEEWKKAERKVNPSFDREGKPTTTWTWNDLKAGEKETELTDNTRKYLLQKIEELNKKGEFTMQDIAAISLKEKLENKKKK